MPPESSAEAAPAHQAARPGSRWRDLDRAVVVIGSAALLSLLSAPMNLHWLHWVAYLPMMWVMREETPRANRWYAWLYGLVGVGLIFRWIVALEQRA